MDLPFSPDNVALTALQAALVALPAAGIPFWAERFRSRSWALVLPLSIAVVVGAIALVPDVAVALSWLALVAIPPLAAAALGWATHGARAPLAIAAGVLLAVGWAAQGTATGEVCLALLTALSCITLGRLLAGVVGLAWLEIGIVAMAVVDAILVFGNQLQAPNEILNTAVPAPGLPQLQYLALPHASLGYGDVFVAGVLGGVLAARRERQWPVALLVLVLSLLWDLMFFVVDVIPATVPVAVALLVVTRGRAGRPRARPARRRRSPG